MAVTCLLLGLLLRPAFDALTGIAPQTRAPWLPGVTSAYQNSAHQVSSSR